MQAGRQGNVDLTGNPTGLPLAIDPEIHLDAQRRELQRHITIGHHLAIDWLTQVQRHARDIQRRGGEPGQCRLKGVGQRLVADLDPLQSRSHKGCAVPCRKNRTGSRRCIWPQAGLRHGHDARTRQRLRGHIDLARDGGIARIGRINTPHHQTVDPVGTVRRKGKGRIPWIGTHRIQRIHQRRYQLVGDLPRIRVDSKPLQIARTVNPFVNGGLGEVLVADKAQEVRAVAQLGQTVGQPFHAGERHQFISRAVMDGQRKVAGILQQAEIELGIGIAVIGLDKAGAAGFTPGLEGLRAQVHIRADPGPGTLGGCTRAAIAGREQVRVQQPEQIRAVAAHGIAAEIAAAAVHVQRQRLGQTRGGINRRGTVGHIQPFDVHHDLEDILMRIGGVPARRATAARGHDDVADVLTQLADQSGCPGRAAMALAAAIVQPIRDGRRRAAVIATRDVKPVMLQAAVLAPFGGNIRARQELTLVVAHARADPFAQPPGHRGDIDQVHEGIDTAGMQRQRLMLFVVNPGNGLAEAIGHIGRPALSIQGQRGHAQQPIDGKRLQRQHGFNRVVLGTGLHDTPQLHSLARRNGPGRDAALAQANRHIELIRLQPVANTGSTRRIILGIE